LSYENTGVLIQNQFTGLFTCWWLGEWLDRQTWHL